MRCCNAVYFFGPHSDRWWACFWKGLVNPTVYRIDSNAALLMLSQYLMDPREFNAFFSKEKLTMDSEILRTLVKNVLKRLRF